MSGIVGIVNLNGVPVAGRLLSRMTEVMDFRGPDARRTWLDGPVGFGHTLLKTTEESEHERQPFSLDGEVWIVADARVDARRDLISKLRAHGRTVPADAADVELILHSYHVWGESCVEHLIGDFAFGIWDGRRRDLFCARDHMGVKPFYYAHLDQCVIFSNTLDCVREHPAVSDKLNDLAVADFLLFGLNQDSAATTFAEIQRLEPAHRATWSSAGFQLSRYWTMPIDEPIYYRRADDYVDRFNELLREAVRDRLRTKRLGIFMSGGLDSPTLAVTATDLLRESSSDFHVRAYTNVMDGFGHSERYYAGAVASSLRIPIQFRDLSSEDMDPNWEQAQFHVAEPHHDPRIHENDKGYYRRIGMHSRVFLYGEGPDNALRWEWHPYFAYLVRQQHYGRLIRDLSSLVLRFLAERRMPFGGRISGWMKDFLSTGQSQPAFPDWLNQSFAMRFQLRSRWERHQTGPRLVHPIRPRGYASMEIPHWQALFESLDAGSTCATIKARHPFLDVRLLRFLLAVPAVPWCRSKYLIRRAMHGKLPNMILRRAKFGIPLDAYSEHWMQPEPTPFVPAQALSYYVDLNRMPESFSHLRWEEAGLIRGLNHWLLHLRRKARGEEVQIDG